MLRIRVRGGDNLKDAVAEYANKHGVQRSRAYAELIQMGVALDESTELNRDALDTYCESSDLDRAEAISTLVNERLDELEVVEA